MFHSGVEYNVVYPSDGVLEHMKPNLHLFLNPLLLVLVSFAGFIFLSAGSWFVPNLLVGRLNFLHFQLALFVLRFIGKLRRYSLLSSCSHCDRYDFSQSFCFWWLCWCFYIDQSCLYIFLSTALISKALVASCPTFSALNMLFVLNTCNAFAG